MCLVAVLLTIFILNLILGLLVHFFDYSEPIWWHALSPYFIALCFYYGLVCGDRTLYFA